MSTKKERDVSVRCPTCGAAPGEQCELTFGAPRAQAHVDRRLAGGKHRPKLDESEMDSQTDVPPVETSAVEI